MNDLNRLDPPTLPAPSERIHSYLEKSGHHLLNPQGALFVPLRGRLTGFGTTANGIYALAGVYAKHAGIEVGVHGLRATAATNALEHESDIAKIQAWLGHANISTPRIYAADNSAQKTLRLSRFATEPLRGP